MAILLYLSHKYQTDAHWYPPQLQACAYVSEYLVWQHVAIQLPSTNVYLCKVKLPTLLCRTGQEPGPPELEGTSLPIYLLPAPERHR